MDDHQFPTEEFTIINGQSWSQHPSKFTLCKGIYCIYTLLLKKATTCLVLLVPTDITVNNLNKSFGLFICSYNSAALHAFEHMKTYVVTQHLIHWSNWWLPFIGMAKHMCFKLFYQSAKQMKWQISLDAYQVEKLLCIFIEWFFKACKYDKIKIKLAIKTANVRKCQLCMNVTSLISFQWNLSILSDPHIF